MAKTIPLKQPVGEKSCVAYVAAMATGTTPKEFMEFCMMLPVSPRHKPPYDDIHIYSYLLSKGYVCGYAFSDENGFHFDGKDSIKSLKFESQLSIYGTPAYVVVEGPIDKGEDHAIYWDGAQIFDSHPGIRNGRHPSCYKIKTWAPIYRFDEKTS